jgi:hypothetical protein
VAGGLAEVLRIEHNVGVSVGEIMHVDGIGPAAHLTILDILLLRTTSWVQGYLVDFPTIGTADLGFSLRGAVAKGELVIQTIIL